MVCGHAGVWDLYVGYQGLGPGPQTSRQTVGDDYFGGVLSPNFHPNYLGAY